jgi:hypothetical protein
MKKTLFILFVFITFTAFSQKELTKDTNFTCIPNSVARLMLRDLNDLDRLKKNETTYKDEIGQLEKKTIKQDSIISKLEEKNKLSLTIIKSTEEKVKLVEEDNKNLRDEIKRVNLKTNIVEIVSGAIMATIIYIQLYK